MKQLVGPVLAGLLVLVGSFEGVRYYAYKDPVGIPTICFGYTHGVRMGDTATPEQCNALLASELQVANAAVNRCITGPLNPAARTALVSLVYNVGPRAVCGSTLQRKFNHGDFRGGCEAILSWKYSRGIVLPGLVKRRQAERDICLGEQRG